MDNLKKKIVKNVITNKTARGMAVKALKNPTVRNIAKKAVKKKIKDSLPF